MARRQLFAFLVDLARQGHGTIGACNVDITCLQRGVLEKPGLHFLHDELVIRFPAARRKQQTAQEQRDQPSPTLRSTSYRVA
jgi:hypothetical protein